MDGKIDSNGTVDEMLIPGMVIGGSDARRNGGVDDTSPWHRPTSHDSDDESALSKTSFDLLPPPLAGKVIDKMYTGLSKVAEATTTTARLSFAGDRTALMAPKDSMSHHKDASQSPSNGGTLPLVSEHHRRTLSGRKYRQVVDGRRASTRRSSGDGGDEDDGDEHCQPGRPSSSASMWCEGKFMIFNRQHIFVRLWWWVAVALSCWNIFQAPFSVAYYDHRPPLLNSLVWAVDIFFMLDILMNFCKPIQTQSHNLITDRKQIALHYVSSRFWIHLLAAVPFDRIFMCLYPDNPYARLVGLTRNLRFQRLILVQKKAEKTISINFEMMVFVKLLITTAMLANFEACLFWYIGIVQAPHGWMHEFGIMASTQGQPLRQHIASLYWAITTFTTVGFGDIHPVNEAEQIYAMIVLVFNLGVGAYIVSCLLMVVNKADSAVLQFRSKVSEVQGYMKTKNIPSDLRNLAIQHLQTSEELAHHTDSPLQHCPPYIRNHVLIHLYRKKLFRVSMLHGVSEEFIDAIICHSEALMSIFQPKTLVARAGERAYNWYVIISGNLEVLDTAGNLVRRHTKGSTLGDKGIIGIPQNYNIKTISLSRLLVVPHSALKDICQHFMADYSVLCHNLISKLEGMKAIDDTDREHQQRAVMEAKLLEQSLRMDCIAKLCRAAAMGDIAGFRALMESDSGHDINACDYQGNRPIHVAAQAGQVDMIRYLVETEGADVNLEDGCWCSPLLAAVTHHMRDAARELRSHGAQLNLRDAGAALSTLVMERNPALLEMYLENGANPDSADYNKRTPLHIACAEGHLHIADLLISYGATTSISDRFGITPLDEARTYSDKAKDPHFIEVMESAVPFSCRRSFRALTLRKDNSDDKGAAAADAAATAAKERQTGGGHLTSALSERYNSALASSLYSLTKPLSKKRPTAGDYDFLLGEPKSALEAFRSRSLYRG